MDEEKAVRGLSALGHVNRLAVFRLLVQAGPAGLTVGEVQGRLGMPGSTLNHHLAALVNAGLVRQHRKGREVWCFAEFEVMHALVAYLTESCCAGFDDAGFCPDQ